MKKRPLPAGAPLCLLVMMCVMSYLTAGCGQKEAPPAQEQITAVSEELPELEQNKLYLNNPLVSGPQDTSFEPVPSEQQEIPKEETELAGPPTD